MVIKSVKLNNFRSHESFVLECDPHTTKIVGENGCGKTSLLEAIYEAMQGKSFRAVVTEKLCGGVMSFIEWSCNTKMAAKQ